jgi:osmotically-inducible protein OsmY
MRNLKRWGLIRGVAAAATLLTLAGCSTSSKSNDERSEGRVADDKQIAEQVQKGLKHEPVYKFTDVDATAFGGIVQLSGFVNTEAQKKRAADIAQQVPGVRQVVNGIALKPEPMSPTGSTNGPQPRIYSE